MNNRYIFYGVNIGSSMPTFLAGTDYVEPVFTGSTFLLAAKESIRKIADTDCIELSCPGTYWTSGWRGKLIDYCSNNQLPHPTIRWYLTTNLI